jgi:hypothetical protein
MKLTYIIYGLIAFSTGCSTKSSETKGDEGLADDSSIQLRIDSIETNDASIKPKTLVEINKILFDNLVNGEFGPHAVENDSGYYVLGIDSYKEQLEKDGIFSEDFYRHEEERVAECKNDLETLRHKGDTDLGWAPNSCFFDFMYWLRSQEHPAGYEIKNLEITGSHARATMVFYNESNGGKSYWDDHVYLDIHYRKEGNEWRVTDLLRLPEN